ncbi:MAG TPA: nuclear transport factor 2 family protein [Bryobacteraceae bacterium]|jgi:ketosteroid isomerase-like protein|nr:nuclear transport factor 2 family protein [Bryobacteraceae bacterium]
MHEMTIPMAAPQELVLSVLMDLSKGQLSEVTAHFAGKFRFKDHGIGLEFTDRERLGEFFQKTRELYPDSVLHTDTILVSGDHVITEWRLQYALTEPFYGGLHRKVQVVLQGASIVRTDNGKVTDWSDYYDGLTSRRTALASYFTEWIEL